MTYTVDLATYFLTFFTDKRSPSLSMDCISRNGNVHRVEIQNLEFRGLSVREKCIIIAVKVVFLIEDEDGSGERKASITPPFSLSFHSFSDANADRHRGRYESPFYSSTQLKKLISCSPRCENLETHPIRIRLFHYYVHMYRDRLKNGP